MMDKAKVSRDFSRHFNGQKNIFTPKVIEYGVAKDCLEWELSFGEVLGDVLYGVTVIEVHGNDIESVYDKSKAFRTEAEAREYIGMLNG
jgi:hypothetical protein